MHTGVALPGTLQHVSVSRQHCEPQQSWPAGHAFPAAHAGVTQTPWLQIWSLGQTPEQLPQWTGSLAKSTHSPPQGVHTPIRAPLLLDVFPEELPPVPPPPCTVGLHAARKEPPRKRKKKTRFIGGFYIPPAKP
jgi:hypothetical protein